MGKAHPPGVGIVTHFDRGRCRRQITLSALALAGAAIMGLLSATPAQAHLAPYRHADPVRTTQAQYQAEVQAVSRKIAGHIGHGPGLPIKVVVNTKQLYGNSPAYTFAYDSSGGTAGAPAKCETFINPSFPKEDTEYQTLALIHEVFHCYEAADYPTVAAYIDAPAWLIEGEAEWVGATLAPTELPVWNDYLTRLSTSLFARSYDAIGFYAHMTNSGQDTWHLLDKMLKAGGSAAAYNVAANKTLRLTWASSLARQSGFGKGWQTTGPGITSATVHPGIQVLANGSDLGGMVAAYTNKLVEFKATANVVDISASTPYSRLHEANGTEHDNLSTAPNAFCVSHCSMCPQMQAMPKLQPGPNWLAVTGDSAGATYALAGVNQACGACLVGHWVVTNFTLTTTPGGAQSGGAGITVDISDNGTAVGNFTPGAPLVGPTGSIKFNGVDTDHYGFQANTTARSGSFISSTVATSLTITVGYPGGVTEPVKPATTQGSYSCVGTGLTLHFVGGPTTLDYTLVPAA